MILPLMILSDSPLWLGSLGRSQCRRLLSSDAEKGGGDCPSKVENPCLPEPKCGPATGGSATKNPAERGVPMVFTQTVIVVPSHPLPQRLKLARRRVAGDFSIPVIRIPLSNPTIKLTKLRGSEVDPVIRPKGVFQWPVQSHFRRPTIPPIFLPLRLRVFACQ